MLGRWMLCRWNRLAACLFVVVCFAGSGHAEAPISAVEGLPTAHWTQANQVLDRVALVAGQVVDVGRAGTVNFLNFSTRRDVFKVVIFRRNLQKFPDSLRKLYHNRRIVVRGMVRLYKGVPQIEVTSPDQIRVVDQLPESQLRPPIRVQVGDTIKVATYNIRNLFDDLDDPYHNDETTRAKPRQELTRLAATIRAMNADVLALQEVESRGYLQRFVDVFLAELGYEVVHYQGNDLRGSGLAVLTRVPVGAVVSHRHRRFVDSTGKTRHFSRDLMCVELQPSQGKPFEVWVVHWKSKRGGAAETEPQRAAEAAEVRRLLNARLMREPDARILVMGDFNDTWASNPLRIVRGQGSQRLDSEASALPREAYTYNLEPHREMIDFILGTAAAQRVYQAGSYQVLQGSLDQNGSDHNPVTARFRF